MNIVNLYENYNNYFSEELKEIFALFSRIASDNNYKIYLVGGIVRDLLLNRENLDIDISVEGDAVQFAKLLEKESEVNILSLHEDFGTAKIIISGQKIDLASTRSESYKKAGHLPQVAEIGCALEKDMVRRDFTINSMALSLNRDLEGEKFADLIDYVGGFEDLKSKKLRILHEKSFIDDPTRIIRGLKYSTRLGFDLEHNTFELQKAYLENINYDMCYKRITNELKLTLSLNSQKCFEKFVNQNIYKLIIEQDVEVPKIDIENLVEKYSPENSWLIYLGVILLKELDNRALSGKLEQLELKKKETSIISNAKKLLNVKGLETDFEIYKEFEGMDLETILIFAVLRDAQKASKYLDFLSKVKLEINGRDLLEMGVKPSRRFTEAFDYVLKAKLVNPLIKKEEEKKLLIEYINRIQM